MTPALAIRVLALPLAVREELSSVPGPGWEVTRGAFLGGKYGTTEARPLAQCGADMSDRYAWWPANPAAALVAVLQIPLWGAHRRIYEACERSEGDSGDDHAAALSLIEASLGGSHGA